MNDEITVVVPYYNETNSIKYTLNQIAKQTLPATRAIFVNSTSTDETSSIVDTWIKSNQHIYQTHFENIFRNTSNPGSSKNIGVQYSDSKWIAFMDCGLEFDLDWLETQFKFVKEYDLDVAMGVVFLTGINWVDRCAVAQTYGYKRNRPCVPSTLVKKSVFNKTGLFHIGRRSGYDMAWRLKLKKTGVKYAINDNVRVAYSGANYAATLTHLFKKSILYARPALGLEGYTTPYFYMLLFSLVLYTATKSYEAVTIIVSGYLLLRVLVSPVVKSNGISFYKEHPFEAMFGLGIAGFIIDLGKMVGYFLGITDYFKKRLKKVI